MEIENLIRYPALAVGLKPSARQGEARLRGLDKDHKPSLSAWKEAPAGLWLGALDSMLEPRASWVCGRLARIPSAWERGRPARTR